MEVVFQSEASSGMFQAEGTACAKTLRQKQNARKEDQQETDKENQRIRRGSEGEVDGVLDGRCEYDKLGENEWPKE